MSTTEEPTVEPQLLTPTTAARTARAQTPQVPTRVTFDVKDAIQDDADRLKHKELRRQMHRVRYYHHGNHYVLNKRHPSMFILRGDSRIRMLLFRFIDNKWFARAIMLCIAAVFAITVVDTPMLRDRAGVTTTLLVFDIIFQVIFTVELLLKMVALGVVMHKHSFFRSAQNIIDFVIVITGFIVFIVNTDDEVIAVRLVRLVRSMRVLGYLARVPLLRSIVIALKNSIPKLRDVMLLMSFVIIGMAVLGLQVFVGTFHQKCYLDVLVNATTNQTDFMLDPVAGEQRCSLNPNSGYECRAGVQCTRHDDIFFTTYLNFDHIGNAIFFVFKMVTMDNWPAAVKVIQESNGVTWLLYAVVIILFGTFFSMNLVLAILSGEYEEVTTSEQERLERELKTKEEVLAAQGHEEEKDNVIVESLKQTSEKLKSLRMNESETAAAIEAELAGSCHGTMLITVNPLAGSADDETTENADDGVPKLEVTPAVDETGASGEPDAYVAPPPATNRGRFSQLRRLLWKNVTGTVWFRTLSIIVTFINILCLAMDHHNIEKTWDSVLNWINFACSVYFIIEAAFKIITMLLVYFRDPFNVFDLLLCVASIPEMALSGSGSGSSLSALRAFRLARVMRVVNTSPRIRQLLITVGNAAFGSAFLFFALFVYVVFAAIFCVIVFPDAVPADVRPNYTNLGNAVLTLFIVLSGENWVDETVKVMTGSSPAAVVFFVIYFVLGNYVILNFVVVILISSYNGANEEVVKEDDMRLVRQTMDSDAHLLVAGARMSPRGSFEVVSFDVPDVEGNPHPQPQPPQSAFDDAAQQPVSETDRPQPVSSPDASEVDDVDDPKGTMNVESLSGRQSAQQTPHLKPTEAYRDVSDPNTTLHFIDHGHTAQRFNANQVPENAQDIRDSFMARRLRHFRAFSLSVWLAELFGLPSDREEAFKQVEGRSLKVFGVDNPFRRAVVRIVTHPYFEALVILVVIQSCIALALDNSESRKKAGMKALFEFNGIFMVVFFALEMLLRWIAFGVVLGDYAYFRSGWNRFDCVVLLLSFIEIFVPFRMVQALRIFRIATKWQAMRVVISSLVHAIPGIANVAFLVAFFFLVAGILGVQLFKGRFAKCNDESIDFRPDCVGRYNVTSVTTTREGGGAYWTLGEASQERNRHWLFSFYNFNHLGEAAMSLTVISYGDGWSAILYDAMDVRSVDFGLKMNDSWWWAIVIVFMMIIANFFLNNLFVGSLMDSFSTERKLAQGAVDNTGHPLLTEKQERWIREYRFALATRLPRVVPKPTNCFRWFFVKMYFADKARMEPRMAFEAVVTFVILFNAVIMCTVHDNMPQYWKDVTDVLNIIFTAFYTLEFAIKVIAMRPVAYIDDHWNKFDLLLLGLSYVSLFADGPGTNGLRVARVARVLRLVKRARGLYRLFQSLVYALPQLFNVSVLLGMILYIFGVAGTQMFEKVYYEADGDTALSTFFNFRNVGYSMMLLFQIGTGEAWADVLAACTVTENNSLCTEAEGNCGTYWSYVFFLLFMVCANSIAINLFIFIVVDNYEEVNQISDRMSQLLMFRLERFRQLWTAIDVDRTGFISWEAFVVIIRQMQVTADDEYERFNQEVGAYFDDDADGDGVADESASDVSDEDIEIAEGDGATAAAAMRPTTADLRSEKFMKLMSKLTGIRDLDATVAKHEGMREAFVGPSELELNDKYFIRKIQNMNVPVGEGGKVMYDDCVYGLVREFYGIGDVMDEDAFQFLSSMVDYDANQVFMVHHGLAITKITRILSRNRAARIAERSARQPADENNMTPAPKAAPPQESMTMFSPHAQGSI
jgi:hemin uptake protein HemP